MADTMKRSPHPTIANYERILSVLSKTSGLWERVDKRPVGVFTPDRRLFYFPHDVVTVTEELHKQGLNLTTISTCGIRQAAIRIIVKDAAPEPVVWKLSNRVISFRIPEQSANVLDEMMHARHIVGIRSRNQFVRRLALDFTAQRLVYPDSGAPTVDWEKLQIRTVSVVKAVTTGTHSALPTTATSPRLSTPFLTDEDITGDIARLIAKLATPYVDPSNPMLHFDDLQAECRAKYAKILHDGCLMRCPTRAKVFAFLKTSFRNHLRGLVQKHAYTAKRTGVKPPDRKLPGSACENKLRKVEIISLDDPDIGLQVGRDNHALKQGEFIDELCSKLSVLECAELDALLSKVPEKPSKKGGVGIVCERKSTAERDARAKLRRKCREILIG